MTLSLCMIVKNEEAVLARCLDCVKSIVDEIILVDTGSLDATKEIAAQYGCQIYDYAWNDDFSQARNFGLERAHGQYILWLDASEQILPESQRRLAALKDRLSPEIEAVMLPCYRAPEAEEGPVFSCYREKIVRNDPALRFEGAVYERIPIGGPAWREDIPVWHDKRRPKDLDRNLRILEKEVRHRPALPRTRYYYGRELYERERYAEAEQQLRMFLRQEGQPEDQVEACRLRARCLRRLGGEEEALTALLRGLLYDVPGAELCCDLGQQFMQRGQLPQAAYWFEVAAHRARAKKAEEPLF